MFETPRRSRPGEVQRHHLRRSLKGRLCHHPRARGHIQHSGRARRRQGRQGGVQQRRDALRGQRPKGPVIRRNRLLPVPDRDIPKNSDRHGEGMFLEANLEK